MANAIRLALIFLASGVAGCGSAALARAPQSIVLTAQSSKSITNVRVGEPVEIRLEAQAGTGFLWIPTRSASMVKAMEPLRPARMRAGGTETQRFRFKAKHKGVYVVSFSYAQPWSGGTKGAKSRSFTISAR